MKIIHCADLHLDSKMETNLTREQADERRGEILQTFVNMVEYAKNNEIQVIIIAGDLFDTIKDSQKRIKTRVLEVIKNAPNIDFLYLQGNHDNSDYYKSLEDTPSNLKFFSNTWTKYQYDDVIIAGVELHSNTQASIYSELALKEDHVNIVVLHGQESQYAGKDKAEIINLGELQNKYIDYLALGHIHEYKYTKLDNRGKYCYPGCLEGRGFDECGEKGFVVLDIHDKSINQTFIKCAKRIFHEIPVDISGLVTETDIINKIEITLQDIPGKDLVKLILCGEVEEEVDIDLAYLKSKFISRFYFIKIYDHTQLRINYEAYEKDISLKGEFIRMVKLMEVSEEEKKQIILTGIKALAGREID